MYTNHNSGGSVMDGLAKVLVIVLAVIGAWALLLVLALLAQTLA